MAYTVVNLLSLLVGLGLLANGYLVVNREHEEFLLFLVSVGAGAGLVFVSLLPNAFETVATVLGLEFKTHAILVVSNLVLFGLVAYLLNRIAKLYYRLSRLNEEVSVLRHELEQRGDE